MSGTTACQRHKQTVTEVRPHDYLYDSAFIVSGAKDYARASFKAAMASAQVSIQPVFRTMFSELRQYPRARIVYYPNCRLPPHVDRSYATYVAKIHAYRDTPLPELAGKDRFKFAALPKKVLPLSSASPEFHPPTPMPPPLPTKPTHRATQTLYRESSAQTKPWQPEAKVADGCDTTPEVLYLDKLEWGPGQPYRTGDLPADFHTTEIINKMRHARTWYQLVEGGKLPRGMKTSDAVIADVETKDWIFREAEIDELQEIRLELLHRMQASQRHQHNSRCSRKLAKLWENQKSHMEKKIEHIRHTRDRELRKLAAVHSGGGRMCRAGRMRAMRGLGSVTAAAADPTSDMYAPLARHGYQARRRHATIVYDPAYLSLEDHKQCSQPPAWLLECGRDLKKSCSGHHLPRDTTQLCERETKWSEEFLEQLHDELKKARMGAAGKSAGPLRVLKPRRVAEEARPLTPEVQAVDEDLEETHQAALLLQKVVRGRAVQTLMYEGRTRAAELTEELKTTHGLQEEDRARIAREQAKAREYTAVRTEAEQKEDAICALVDELCGGAVSAALDFLEKELRRLKEERRQHAFILIAMREKIMREAAEAGRRQKEMHRMREHDEIFKQVLGVTQATVEEYLREIIKEGVELAAEEDAAAMVVARADEIEVSMDRDGSMSTAEQHETVAELVHQFLLPEAHRQAARMRISALQSARTKGAKEAIFGLLDESAIVDSKFNMVCVGPSSFNNYNISILREKRCSRSAGPLDDSCVCPSCPAPLAPTETAARDDPRWRHTRTRPVPPEKTWSERFPPHHEFRCMLDALIDEVVRAARDQKHARELVRRDVGQELTMQLDKNIEVKGILDLIIDRATGALPPPLRVPAYRHYSRRHIQDALTRTPPCDVTPCPLELPSEIRRRAEAELDKDTRCYCVDEENVQNQTDVCKEEARTNLLPSALRTLEEVRRCKCDADETVPVEDTTDTEYSSGIGADRASGAESDGRDPA